jgi:hypothetical protein
VGSVVLSQYGTASIPTDGVTIGKVVVADNFGTVYNDLNPAAPLTPFQSWQVLYFGNTNNPDASPIADPDKDGMNNQAEFLAGTIPTNSASVFEIPYLTREGNNIRVTWIMGSGRTNVLQRTFGGLGGSIANSFTDLSTVITTSSITNYLDLGVVTNAPAAYYRVRIGP